MLTNIIDDIRNRIGRDVTFYTVTLSGCPVCSLDPNTDTSTDSYCITCSGLYWIPTYSGNVIKAHVTWGKADQLEWVSGGQYFDGDCRVQIKYTDVNITVADTTTHVNVDGRTLKIKNVIPRGVPELNRILINLVEE